VAGALLYSKYNPLVRFVMKRIAKEAGAATDTSRDYEYTDWVGLDRFVVELAEAFAAARLDCAAHTPAGSPGARANENSRSLEARDRPQRC
jgi:hypothetical protein